MAIIASLRGCCFQTVAKIYELALEAFLGMRHPKGHKGFFMFFMAGPKIFAKPLQTPKNNVIFKLKLRHTIKKENGQ